MNLLSRRQKDAVMKDVASRFFGVLLALFSFWTLVFLVISYNSVLYLDMQIPSIEERIKQEGVTSKSNIVKTVEEEINTLNKILVRIDRIRKEKLFNFPHILRVIGDIMPEGLELQSISFQGEIISIRGHADKRAGVIELKERLEKEPVFHDVTSPLSNIIKEEDIDFNFSFSL